MESAIFNQRPTLPKGLLKEMARVSPWKSVVLCIAIYAASFGLAFVGGAWSNWWLAPLSFLLIGALQNHLLILLHEGAHGLMHPNKKWNEFFTDLFCAVPIFMVMRNYRAMHLHHHQFSGEEGLDPEIDIYRGQNYHYARRGFWGTAWMLAKDFFGLNILPFQLKAYKFVFKLQAQGKHKVFEIRDLVFNLVFWGIAGYLLFHFGVVHYFLIFWVLPYVTLTFFLLKLHGYGEHTGVDGPTEFERTWFHDFHPIVDFFIYPIYSGYHIEHHLYPTVPWYNIKAFRAELLKNPYYAQVSEKTTAGGYFFGKNAIFKTMVYGNGRYSDEPTFVEAVRSRREDLKRFS